MQAGGTTPQDVTTDRWNMQELKEQLLALALEKADSTQVTVRDPTPAEADMMERYRIGDELALQHAHKLGYPAKKQ